MGTERGGSVPDEFLAEPRRYFLEWIPSTLRAHDGAAAHFGQVSAVAQFCLTGERGGQWYVELGAGDVRVGEGAHARPSFTLTMSVDVWQQIHRGTLNGLRAYLRGDVTLAGSRWKLLRVGRLLS